VCVYVCVCTHQYDVCVCVCVCVSVCVCGGSVDGSFMPDATFVLKIECKAYERLTSFSSTNYYTSLLHQPKPCKAVVVLWCISLTNMCTCMDTI